MSRLAPWSGGVAAIHERGLALYDARGARVGARELERSARAVARFGDEWLVLGDKRNHLTRVGLDATEASFGSGSGVIGAFGVGRDDAVVIARRDRIELWSRDDDRRWATKGGPFAQAVLARDHVVALGDDGALVFFSRDGGEALGALRLASPEPTSSWRLVHVDAGVVVLTLGDWLVWIDASTRKTVRRVRARAKVVESAADPDHVAVAVEDGGVQVFRSKTGEPRAAFSVDEGVSAIALGAEVIFTMGASGPNVVRATDRRALDAAVRVASPISAVAARAGRAAVSDRTGSIRVFDVATYELHEVGSFAGPEGTLGLFLSKDAAVVAAGARAAMRVSPPHTTPRPVALKGVPTAFAADETYVFAGTQTGAVDVYDVALGRNVTSYTLSSEDRITALARLPGALLVAGTGALDGRVLFIDVADAKVVHRISPHDEAFGVTCLASDGRGRIVASGGDDGFVALIDPGKGRILARLRVNETPTSMAFEPSGRRLACVFGDGTASIVTFTPKGATLADLGVRGATHVAWGDCLVLGFKDGHVENGDRYARPSERPGARE